MSALSFQSEQAFLDYSFMLSQQMPNVKLNTLRKAMAGVDHYRSIKSYRESLRAAEAKPVTTTSAFPSRVFIDSSNTLNIVVKTDAINMGLDENPTNAEIDSINNKLEFILGGDAGYKLENFATKKTDDGQYEAFASLELNKENLDDVRRILAHLFSAKNKHDFLSYCVAKHAVNKAFLYIGNSELEDILELEPNDYTNEVNEFMIPFSSDYVRNAVSDELRNDFDCQAQREADDLNLSLEQITVQSGQDLMAALIEHALGDIKRYVQEHNQPAHTHLELFVQNLASAMVLNTVQ